MSDPSELEKLRALAKLWQEDRRARHFCRIIAGMSLFGQVFVMVAPRRSVLEPHHIDLRVSVILAALVWLTFLKWRFAPAAIWASLGSFVAAMAWVHVPAQGASRFYGADVSRTVGILSGLLLIAYAVPLVWLIQKCKGYAKESGLANEAISSLRSRALAPGAAEFVANRFLGNPWRVRVQGVGRYLFILQDQQLGLNTKLKVFDASISPLSYKPEPARLQIEKTKFRISEISPESQQRLELLAGRSA